MNLPAGTYYVAGWTYGSQGQQVVRGAGAKSTYIYLTGEAGCGGQDAGICMITGSPIYGGNPAVLPPSGNQQCMWTGGLTKGSTSLTLSSCGGAPTAGQLMVLDQANDTSDTGGIYICDSVTVTCTVESNGNYNGRQIGGVTHSQKQVVYVNSVTSLGGASYTVTVTPGVYFNNIRSSQTPGAWWLGIVQNDGLENMTLDQSGITDAGVGMYTCYQCWVKGVRSIDAGRSHVELFLSAQDVVRDSYFYKNQSTYSESYTVEIESSSSSLVENNIFQQETNSLMFGQGSGMVVDYNFSIDNQYAEPSVYVQTANAGHNAGNGMNLWEGNNFIGVQSDDSWGASTVSTFFRNNLLGWMPNKSQDTIPLEIKDWSRAFNVIGNVLGQPGYATIYESYATSSSGGVSGGSAAPNVSIYALGWNGYGGIGGCSGPSPCDPLVRPTLMRWGNYDVVNAAVQWNSTEASPAAVPYVNANFTSSYFSSLAHTLPNSLYYSSEPSWWPSSVAWPPIGSDVTGGNIGECSGGTYAGAQAISAGQCTGGTLSTAWASHVNANPAQVCYLNVMGGPPDGTGSVLSFDASQCYASSGTSGGGTPPAPPTGLTASVN